MADPITILILYAILTAVVLLMIAPAFFPAMLVYRNFHSKIVNSLRTNLAKNGVGIIKIDRRAVFSVLDEKETEYVLGEEVN